jgi:DHA3 family tetracycline resistance protein-like MFS transporter
MTAGSSLFYDLVFTVNMVYQATIVGLNPLQLVLVGTTLEVSAFLFEIPTGIVADLYSRKLSIVIGFALIGVGFILEGSVPQFWAILLSQVLWGIGYTFTSGAREAWLADEIGEKEANPLYLRASQVAMIAGLVGIAISTAIGTVSLQLPIQIGGALFLVLSLFIWIFMPENGFQPTPAEDRNSWRQMSDTAVEAVRLVRIKPALMTVMVLSLVYGLYSEGMDRLWTPHLLDNFTFPTIGNLEPVVWFGMISAAGMLLSIGAVEIVRRTVDTNSPRAVPVALAIIYGIMALATVGFALAFNFPLALMALLMVRITRSGAGPLFTAWINQNVESRVRATVFSAYGQLNAVGQMIGGPAVGAIGTVYGLRLALTIAGIILSPTLWIFQRSLRRPAVPIAQAPSDAA